MVHIKSSFVFLLSAASLALATPAQIEAQITGPITGNLTALNTALNNFPSVNATLVQALTINTDSANLVTALNGGTTLATANGLLSIADGTTIINEVTTIEPIIVNALKVIVAKRPAFVVLNGEINGILALVTQDLETLNSSTAAFANALVADAPPSLIVQATALRSAILGNFTTALAAYLTPQ